jgi:deoxyribodipyrimidine photo-lyase
VCDRTLQFIIDLGRNIPGLQVFTGEFKELLNMTKAEKIRFREHPLFNHYQGARDDRPWMFPDVTTASGGFFGFWKKCERRLEKGF